ncbi:MAG: hypothetical protein E6Q24_15025 [Chitinophagaceae bacterium]|nr:MAG: hypothetical protein E6Q24_15025 [Chitinophagaceae bacterium]
MKRTILLLAFVAVAACRSTGNQNDISGTYVNTQADDLKTVFDTLDVRPANSQSRDAYEITIRSRVVFKNADDAHFNKTNQDVINATLDATNSILRTEDPGILYNIDTKTTTLRLGEAVYEKIK